MDKEQIITNFYSSRMNAEAKKEAVNALRHLSMDQVKFNIKDNEAYTAIYSSIMEQIASDYSILSIEVKRQMDKKNRRRVRRSLEEQQIGNDT